MLVKVTVVDFLLAIVGWITLLHSLVEDQLLMVCDERETSHFFFETFPSHDYTDLFSINVLRSNET